MGLSNSVSKSFFHYVIPSVLSFVLVGVYCFVDAYFVGNTVGDSGLAAINISFAFLCIMQALGTGIGLGASVKYTVTKASGDDIVALDYIGCANIIMLVASAAVTIPMLLFPTEILTAMGASPKVAEIGKSYFLINAYGTLFQLMGTGLIPIIRNCGGSVFAMFASVSGCILNIALDWLFVWGFNAGIAGAAIATVVSQIVVFVMAVFYLYKKKRLILRCRYILKRTKEIAAVGISPFGLTIVPNISVIIINKAALAIGGDVAIAAYGCIAYLVFVVYLVFQGIGDGAQPLISQFYGELNYKNATKVKKLTLIVAFSVAVLSFLFESLLSMQLANFMGSKGESAQIIAVGLPIMAVGFFFVAVSRSVASFLYASESNLKCYAVSYSEPVFILIVLMLLGKNSLNNVWISNTIGQFLVMILSVVLLLADKVQQNLKEQ